MSKPGPNIPINDQNTANSLSRPMTSQNLPTTVQDMLKKQWKLKSSLALSQDLDQTRYRRLSDTGPLRHTNCRDKSKPKSAEPLHQQPPRFIPSLSSQVQHLSTPSKKPANQSRKMDMYVPSLGMANAQFNFGPHPSIYESDNVQCTVSVPNPSFFGSERTDLSTVGEDITSFVNPGLDSVNMEDFSNLDNFENSNLNSLVDVLSRWQGQDKEAASTKICANAMEIPKVPISSCGDNIGFNPTLAELNTTDSFNVDDILGFDQESSKLSDASFDSMVDVKTSLHSRPLTQVQGALFTDVSNSFPAATSQSLVCESPVQVTEIRGNNMSKNYARYFPPRQSNPPVGVVMPVMQAEVKPDLIKQEQKPHFNLEDLLSKSTTIKSEPGNYQGSASNASKMVPVSGNDLPAQIVPNSDSRKRDSGGNIKPQGFNPASGSASWQDIESIIRDDKTQPPVKRQRHDSGSSGHNSNDDEYGEDEDDDSPLYGGNNGGDDSDDDMSDIDADLTTIRPGEVESLIPLQMNTSTHGKKQQKPVQYFWQYNVQAKGPKGTRLKLTVESPADPHVLNDFEDPVFDECNTSIAGIRHGGKARKGDGNEITPNPFKLFLIGHQLARLNKRINACCMQISGPAGNGVSASERNASRKEKNKLASRACRLKKKAQHEANKIKLHGLALEHGQLHMMSTKVLTQMKERARALTGAPSHLNSMHTQSSLVSTVATQIDKSLDCTDGKVAGQSVDYVNGVILNVESGDKDGGLKRGKRLQFKS